MAVTRLLRMSNPIGLGFSDQVSSSTSPISHMGSKARTLMCLKKARLSTDDQLISGGERKPVSAKATCLSSCVLVSKPNTDVDLSDLNAYVSEAVSPWLNLVTRPRPWGLHLQMLIEKAIIDCRFFTMLAVAGSLLSSLLCYVEGIFQVIESYSKYIHALSSMSEQGHVILLLIKAIDMFLVGTAMLIFGMALYVLFIKGKVQHPSSSSPRNYILQKLPSLLGMESALQAKSKIGHALIMILHVEMLGKFKSIPLSTSGLDLACFAGTVLLSSASIFILSRIAFDRAELSKHLKAIL